MRTRIHSSHWTPAILSLLAGCTMPTAPGDGSSTGDKAFTHGSENLTLKVFTIGQDPFEGADKSVILVGPDGVITAPLVSEGEPTVTHANPAYEMVPSEATVTVARGAPYEIQLGTEDATPIVCQTGAAGAPMLLSGEQGLEIALFRDIDTGEFLCGPDPRSDVVFEFDASAFPSAAFVIGTLGWSNGRDLVRFDAETELLENYLLRITGQHERYPTADGGYYFASIQQFTAPEEVLNCTEPIAATTGVYAYAWSDPVVIQLRLGRDTHGWTCELVE